jgi:hypothetical protein
VTPEQWLIIITAVRHDRLTFFKYLLRRPSLCLQITDLWIFQGSYEEFCHEFTAPNLRY